MLSYSRFSRQLLNESTTSPMYTHLIKLIRLFLIVLSSTSFYSEISCQSQFVIEGRLENAEGLNVMLAYTRGALVTNKENFIYDTTTVVDGLFKFEGMVEHPRYHTISVEEKPGWKTFILENTNYTISGDANSIWIANLQGTKEININKWYSQRSRPLTIKANAAADSSRKYFKLANDSLRTHFHKKHNESKTKKRLLAKDLVHEFPDSYTSLFHFRDLDEVLEIEERRILFGKFSERIKKHPLAKAIQYELYELNHLVNIGEKALLFSLKDQYDYVVNVSDFYGRYLILDFWTSYHAVSITAEHPFLQKLHENYHSMGLDILSISTIKDIEVWKQVVKHENLPWQQVIDLEEGENRVAAACGIKKHPTYFLLDRQGVIVGKYHDRYVLRKVIESIFEF